MVAMVAMAIFISSQRQCNCMGETTLRMTLNSSRMIDLAAIRKMRGIPASQKEQGFISDDSLAKKLLLEKIDECLGRNIERTMCPGK